jgi:glycosyltransferase involved in cell wall biosynthesis
VSRWPRVSVVVPCYNLGPFLREATSSVAAQTYTDWEVLIVDDGSTDETTHRTLEELEREGMRVVRTANRGLSAARNTGIALTRGRYVCCLDADDRLDPTWLERAVPLLDADDAVAFVSHWMRAFGDQEWDWTPVRCDLSILLDVNTVNGAALVRRAVVEDAGGFDETMREGCEDWEFWIRVTSRGHQGIIVPEVLYRYRRREDSMSRSMHASDTHARLYGDLVARHPGPFNDHLLDLVLRREWTLGLLHRQIDLLAEERRCRLDPAIEERRAEQARGEARLAEIQEAERLSEALAAERAALMAQRRHAAEVFNSWSWRLTAPFRSMVDLLRASRKP